MASLTLGSSKLKTSLEAPKPIFRLDFEHICFDNHLPDQSLVSLFHKQLVQNVLINYFKIFTFKRMKQFH